MTIGTLWTKIRIGMRVAINGSSTASILTNNLPHLLVGVCQGSNGFLTQNTTDYIGGATWWNTAFTFVQASPTSYYTSTSLTNPVKKIGSTVTQVGGGAATAYFTNAVTVSRSQLFVDILKGSPNYTITMWAPTSAGAVQTDISSSTFLANIENEAAPGTTSALGAVTAAYSGASLFDTVSVSWLRSTPTIEISDIAICRFY
jgi:hypothetical protein